MSRLISWLTSASPLWILLCSGLALVEPGWFTWFKGQYTVWGLGVIMLGMGLTLTFEDFKGVIAMPRAGIIGVCCQFVIMPLLGWGLGLALHGISVWLLGAGGNLRERMVQTERERLQREQDRRNGS